MTSRGSATDWRELREFRDTELTASFVLAWQLDGNSLTIDIDLKLEASHPFYEKPRPAERVCIRPAVLEFPYCFSLALKDVQGAATDKELAATLGLGQIHGFSVYDDGVYELSGKFGTVIINAERPVLRLAGR